MLKTLSITNYALIDQIQIHFSDGLSTITGETGAGKSIMLGALSLILGNRADTSVLHNPLRNCIVEGHFLVSKMEDLKLYFQENDLDYDDICIIRRQINSNGKSRAFVNDIPVNLNILKELGSFLIDVHSQHQTLELNKNTFQLKIVDTYIGNQDNLNEYANLYQKWQQTKKAFDFLKEKAKISSNEADFINHQYEELKNARLIEGELEKLESEQNILENAEQIKNILLYSSSTLNADEAGLLVQLKNILAQLTKISNYNTTYAELYKRLDSIYIDLKDFGDETENLGERIDLDKSELEMLNNRLSFLYSLVQKYKTENIEGLMSRYKQLENQISEIDSFDFDLEQLKKKTDKAYEQARLKSKEISDLRKKNIPHIQDKVSNLLKLMGMPNGQFLIHHANLEEINKLGCDEIKFLFTANKQVEAQDISKIASGGELSRLMLSLKSLMSSNGDLPTIIFDEIDAGVSGEIADKMGNLIKDMSNHLQIINITHLPQIASKGDHHFKVYKEDNQHSTTTKIALLNQEDRIKEIAQMLSGETITEEAILNAKSLLQFSKQ